MNGWDVREKERRELSVHYAMPLTSTEMTAEPHTSKRRHPSARRDNPLRQSHNRSIRFLFYCVRTDPKLHKPQTSLHHLQPRSLVLYLLDFLKLEISNPVAAFGHLVRGNQNLVDVLLGLAEMSGQFANTIIEP